MQRTTLVRTLGGGVLALSMLAGGAGAYAQTAQPAGPTTTTVAGGTTPTATTSTTAASGAGSGITTTTASQSTRTGAAGWSTR